jgi:hypothetical protein
MVFDAIVMTRSQKAFGIAKRLEDPLFLNAFLISSVVIAHWLAELEKNGVIEAPNSLSEKGENIYALCSEFDWQVEDDEIKRYCEANMPDNTAEEKEIFFTIIKATIIEKAIRI